MSDRRDLDDAGRWLAAEHALGVTEGARRAEAERRLERDAGFRQAVEGWQAQLEPFLNDVEPVTPPDRVWRAIERGIGAPPDVQPPARPAARPAARMGLWRALALLGTGAAFGAGLAATVLLDRPGGPPGDGDPPVLVATLVPSGEAPTAVARLDAEADALVIRVALPEAAEQVPELWLIPGDGVPRSLGVIEEGTGELRVPLDRLDGLAPAPGDALAVSLEPPGGSPTGAPTGPVVASGALVEL